MNGATTQADVLGIVGREGLDLANRWTTPAAGSPAYLAMKMYRNYDGQDSSFGDTSVATTVPNPDQVSAFSALRSADGTLTIMVVNKNLYNPSQPSATTSITLTLGNFTSDGSAEEWQLAAVSPANQTQAAISHLADVHFSGNSFTISVPMQSVTLFVLHPQQVGAPAAPTGLSAQGGDGQVSLSWNAAAGTDSYNIYRATTAGGEGSVPYRTGLTGTAFTDTNVTNGVVYYYRVTAVNAQGEGAKSAEVSARPVSAAADGTAIDAGAAAIGSFAADTGYSGGHAAVTTHAIDLSRASNPAPQAVYQTWRAGAFSYTAGNLTAGVAYTVRLHFAENVATAAGRQVFNVLINGGRVLRNFDVFAVAGRRYRAIVREFTATANSGGAIVIQFKPVVGSARVNGIEVWRRPVVAVNAGGPAAGAYGADAYFSGGVTANTTAAIDTSALSDPAAQSVYRSARVGDFTYTLTGLTPAKSFTVRLDFAETTFTASGQRLFDVTINGNSVLSDFDIFAAAGGKNRAVRREFAATADVKGHLTISFLSTVGAASVGGIAVF